MSKRPYIKSDASGNLTDLELDAASLDGHIMEQTGISSNTTTIPTTAQVKSYVDANASGIIELPNQTNRITDLDTGIYKLTYNGSKNLLYNGTTGTNLHTVKGGAEAVILYVNKSRSSSLTYWRWLYMSGTSGGNTIYYGDTTTSLGEVGNAIDLEDVLTSHSYRPIQVNGTTILANTSGNALNLSNDGNVKFAQVSGGKVKASITGLEVAKLYDFTVYNDTYTWGHLTSSNGYTQLFSLDTANGASIGLAEKDGKLSMQIDGDYYGNEGEDRLSYYYETPITCLSSVGGTPDDISYDDAFFKGTPYIGTVYNSQYGWQNLINIRHRGGRGGDGTDYGMQLRTALVSEDSLWYRQQTSANYWTDWKKIQNDLELTYHGSSTNDQLKMYKNGCRFYIYITAPSDSVQSLSQINANGTATTTHTVKGGGLVIVKRDTDNFVQVSINTTGTHANYTDTTDSAYTRITTSNIMVDCWRH